jgi:xanthine dehydrogenase molybdenum-binding subunit
VALGFWFNGGMESSSSATVNADGTVSLILGSTDIGGTRASLAMQLAETLGIPTSTSEAARGGHRLSVGYTGVTGGSRTTFAGGWVAYELGPGDRRQLVGARRGDLGGPAGPGHLRDDGVITGPGRRGRLGAVVHLQGDRRASCSARAASSPSRPPSRTEHAGPAYAGHIVDLHVDRETGKVQILRYTAVQDVGTAIHPSYVEGQIQGGVAQGVGMALNEEYVYNDEGSW